MVITKLRPKLRPNPVTYFVKGGGSIPNPHHQKNDQKKKGLSVRRALDKKKTEVCPRNKKNRGTVRVNESCKSCTIFLKCRKRVDKKKCCKRKIYSTVKKLLYSHTYTLVISDLHCPESALPTLGFCFHLTLLQSQKDVRHEPTKIVLVTIIIKWKENTRNT